MQYVSETFWIYLKDVLKLVIKSSLNWYVLKTSGRQFCKASWRCLDDVLNAPWRSLEDVLKIFARRLQNVLKTSWGRLRKTSWICLEDVLKTSSKRLEDVMEVSERRFCKTSLRRFENVLKTSWRGLEEVLPRIIYWSWSIRLEDVFSKRNACWGIYYSNFYLGTYTHDANENWPIFKTLHPLV